MTRPKIVFPFFVIALASLSAAQDRLPGMPGYDRFAQWGKSFQAQMAADFQGYVRGRWSEDGKTLFFQKDGGWQTLDLSTGKIGKGAEPPAVRQQGFGFDRAKQNAREVSPDRKLVAISRDRNVYIADADGKNEYAVTKNGSVASRVKYGTASWVYGEELAQDKAMWWSPDGSMLAFYRFDESKVPDYYMAFDLTSRQDTLGVEAYPMPGKPNPVAELLVYDLKTKGTKKLDTAFKSGNGDDLGHYVYNVKWSPDGKYLLYFRMNRPQNVQEFVAANPKTGENKVVFHEAKPDGWVEPKPNGPWPTPNYDVIFQPKLEGKPLDFYYISERSGYRNVWHGVLPDGNMTPVTKLSADVGDVVLVDHQKKEIWYTAHDGSTPYRVQLHRVNFDGTGDVRLTNPNFSHGVQVSPTGSGFLDTAQTYDIPATTVVRDADGKQIAVLATANKDVAVDGSVKPVEAFSCLAADGKTTIYGRLSKPSNFDPNKKYPLLLEVYGGPGFGTESETFTLSSPYAEMGFVVAWVDGRGSIWRGRDFAQALYHKFGIVEVDDQMAAAKYLSSKTYIDGSRIGIYGTSYGGYLSLMAAVRYPDLVKAAVVNSAVTDYRNYDSTYTERYLGVLEGNEAVYDAGSAFTYLKALKAPLLIYFGTADDNVHPANSVQLVAALDRLGKSYQMVIGPDQGHSAPSDARVLEFFVDHLITKK